MIEKQGDKPILTVERVESRIWVILIGSLQKSQFVQLLPAAIYQI